MKIPESRSVTVMLVVVVFGPRAVVGEGDGMGAISGDGEVASGAEGQQGIQAFFPPSGSETDEILSLPTQTPPLTLGARGQLTITHDDGGAPIDLYAGRSSEHQEELDTDFLGRRERSGPGSLLYGVGFELEEFGGEEARAAIWRSGELKYYRDEAVAVAGGVRECGYRARCV
ncbi:hypothetical protein SASPL_157170 [Salvia splendens]|uniref:Dirigent protein n=1 Tax=Salvia splendens TaxID=180675 RepID=A0A8X8VVD5_SALSN|nr:hypothetical protein SASPL_157170 [Salvia splendens]